VGLRHLDSSDFGLAFHQGHGSPTVVSVVCSNVEVSAPADHSYRGVLQSVACLNVIVKTR
jgi:hypothetical protein